MEILASVDALRWIAAYAPRYLADQRLRNNQLPLRGKRSQLVRDPVGVVGVATPWSSPWASGMRRVANALMAGNGVVLVPDPLVPLTAVRLVRALERAGVPEGLVRVAAGRADLAAALEQGGAGRVVRIGTDGRDPMLVLADAPLRHAVYGALWAAFADAGQSRVNVSSACTCGARLADAFIEGLVGATSRLRLGDPRRWDIDLGPAHQRRAPRARARRSSTPPWPPGPSSSLRWAGRPRRRRPGPFYAPAVLRGVTPRHADHARGRVRPRAARSSPSTARTRPSRSPTTVPERGRVGVDGQPRPRRAHHARAAGRAVVDQRAHAHPALSPARVAASSSTSACAASGALAPSRPVLVRRTSKSLARDESRPSPATSGGRESERLRARARGRRSRRRLARRCARPIRRSQAIARRLGPRRW